MVETTLSHMKFDELFQIPSFTIGIIGGTGCGKTTLLKYILTLTKKHFNYVFLFQGSIPSDDNLYIDCVWPADIEVINNLDDKGMREEFLKKITEYTTDITKYNNDIKDHNLKSPDNQIQQVRTLFVFDDFGPGSKYFSTLANVSRHALSSYIYLIHNDIDIDPPLRKKLSHIFLAANFMPKQILENFKGIRNKFDDFRKQLLDNNEKKSFLVVNSDNPNQLRYINLTLKEVELTNNNNSLFYRCSKQRKQLTDALKSLANELRTEAELKIKNII